MAFARLSSNCWNNAANLLSKPEQTQIITMAIKSILNSVIFDPLLPTPNLESLGDAEFIEKFRIGRGVELFDWFSFLMIRKNSMTKLRELL